MAKIIHNDTVDVLLERVSIRAFKDEAIGLDVLNTIEQAAQNTASSQYLNDWSAIRIKDPAVKPRSRASAIRITLRTRPCSTYSCSINTATR